MKLQTIALHPVFAAEVTGVDLSAPLSAGTVQAIHDGMNQHAVLLFRNQRLTEQDQMRVGESLGTVESQPASVGQGNGRLQDARMNDISNLGPDGELLPEQHARRLFNLGNRLWHTDSSFKALPSKYSLLYGKRIPSAGGDTEFADMRAAYDGLDEQWRAEIDSLIAHHSLLYSRALLGFDQFSDQERERYTPVRQRLVRRHPGSARLGLYLAAHIGAVEGMSRPEAMMLVHDLIEHATRPEWVYRHQWQTDDLIIWDNRCTMHRATRYPEKNEVRDMRRVTIEDDCNTLEQPR